MPVKMDDIHTIARTWCQNNQPVDCGRLMKEEEEGVISFHDNSDSFNHYMKYDTGAGMC